MAAAADRALAQTAERDKPSIPHFFIYSDTSVSYSYKFTTRQPNLLYTSSKNAFTLNPCRRMAVRHYPFIRHSFSSCDLSSSLHDGRCRWMLASGDPQRHISFGNLRASHLVCT